VLTSCPAGYSARTTAKAGSEDLQQCLACGSGQYILSPDTDDCQACPPGLVCRGDDVVAPRQAGSTWARNGSIYRLTSCPTGYRVVASVLQNGGFDATVQDCQPCDEGTECTLSPSCVVCLACPPGTFKSLQSASPCQACPPDTYNARSGSRVLSDCLSCPDGSSTLGKFGQQSLFGCHCDAQHITLRNDVLQTVECLACPKGGLCLQDMSCALSRPPTFSCPANTTIIGTWILNAHSNLYDLMYCPPGFSLQSTLKTGSKDLQECKPCQKGEYILNPNEYDCQPCPAGANCSDPTKIIPLVPGSIWSENNGIWKIVSCPAGYVLNIGQYCSVCPATFYCIGGSLPAAPCGTDKYSLPGAISSASCSYAVFIFVAVDAPILRPDFTDTVEQRFRLGLAHAAEVNIDNILLTTVAPGNNELATNVIYSIARPDAYQAAAAVEKINSTLNLLQSLNAFGFENCTLNSIQVTSCIPGYELLPNKQCSLCPENYFCVGGSTGRESCPSSAVSVQGANSPDSCVKSLVNVIVLMSIPISFDQFTPPLQERFRTALALAAHVQKNHVVILGFNAARREIVSNMSIMIRAAISVIDSTQALATSQNIALGVNLTAQGLPQGTLVEMETKYVAVDPGSSYDANTKILVSVTAVLAAILTPLLYFSYIKYREHYALKSLIWEIQHRNIGDDISKICLPIDLGKLYKPESIVGKNSRGSGCVVKAKKIKGKHYAAIKFIFPKKNKFTHAEKCRFLLQEQIFNLFSTRKCEYSAILNGDTAFRITSNVCWFTMDFVSGKNLEQILYPSPNYSNGSLNSSCNENNLKNNSTEQGEKYSLDSAECITMSQHVLAALKLMHSERLLHKDVKPVNILCSEQSRDDSINFIYKLINFSSATQAEDNSNQDNVLISTDVDDSDQEFESAQYMSPEMLSKSQATTYPTDLWSLGVTMFEAVTGCLPLSADVSDSQAISDEIRDLESKLPSVLDRMDESKRAKFDHGLALIIEKALEKRMESRFATVDEMHGQIYQCLVMKGEASYSIFISYRVASEAPLAKLLFDELNHAITPGGHHVTVYWDAHRLVKGQDWEEGFSVGLLNSVVYLPLLSFGFTAPLASLPDPKYHNTAETNWYTRPMSRERLCGLESDMEDNVLKEVLIASALLERSNAGEKISGEKGIMQLAYPILIGRQYQVGEAGYPGMGNFFQVQVWILIM